MDDFVNLVNLQWRDTDPVRLAAFALWNLNNIHPFENGNGRTARALCYFILCAKLGGLLPGTRILPTLLAEEPTRSQYVAALAHADSSNDLDPLIDLIRELPTGASLVLIRPLGARLTGLNGSGHGAVPASRL